MRFQFLYLDKDGVETKVETLDDLRRCVEDGRIGEDTLLYDARSREWGPARVHTAYRSVVGDPSPDEPLEDGSAGEGAGDDLGEEGLALTDAVPDTVGRFLEKRARERREEDERRATALDELPLVDESTVWASDERDDERDDDPGAAGDDRVERDTPSTAERAGGESGDRAPPRPPAALPSRPDPTPVTVQVNATGGRSRRRRRLWTAATVVLTTAGLLAARSVFSGSDAAETGTEPVVDTGPPPAANPELEARIREAEGSAFQDMIVAMDSLRSLHEVTGGPRDWLSGRYLAHASEFGDVEAYWERYRAYVGELRSRDEELFRRGFVERLERSGLEGAVLSMRLARATEQFRSTGASRDTVYTAMDEMAQAALDLHRLLVEREDDIAYTPVRPGVVTRDPVLEAVPNDEELRNRIWDTLDRLFARMDVVLGGVPGSGNQLSDAALEGIRSTAGRYEP